MARGIYVGIDNKARRSETGYIGVKKSATNILKNGSLHQSYDGWSIPSNYVEVTPNNGYVRVKGLSSRTGTNPVYQAFDKISGSTAETKQVIYVCAKVRGTRNNKSYPRVYLSYYAGTDTTVSYAEIKSRDGKEEYELNDDHWHFFSGSYTTFNSTNYYSYDRIAFGIGNTEPNDIMDFKEIFLVNLTATFGSGNEPSREWCDKHYANYADSIPTDKDTSVARRIRRGYVGVDGKARLIYVRAGKLEQKLQLSVGRTSMGAAGNKKYTVFAGGQKNGLFTQDSAAGITDVVDAYDENLVRTSTTLYSILGDPASATVGETSIIFAGGTDSYPYVSSNTVEGEATEYYGSNSVTIFDGSTLTKTKKTLVNEVFYPAGASNSVYAIFAGGEYATRAYSDHKYVTTWHNITTTQTFNSTGTRSTISSVGGGRLGSASTNDYAFFFSKESTIQGVNAISTTATKATATVPTGKYQDEGRNAWTSNATHMYVGGGYKNASTTTTDMQVYDNTLTAITIGVLDNPLNNIGMNIGGRACFYNLKTKTIESYNPRTFVKSYLDSLDEERYDFATCNKNKLGFIAGGFNDESSSDRVIYSDIWLYTV